MEVGSLGWYIMMFIGGIGLGVALAAAWRFLRNRF